MCVCYVQRVQQNTGLTCCLFAPPQKKQVHYHVDLCSWVAKMEEFVQHQQLAPSLFSAMALPGPFAAMTVCMIDIGTPNASCLFIPLDCKNKSMVHAEDTLVFGIRVFKNPTAVHDLSELLKCIL